MSWNQKGNKKLFCAPVKKSSCIESKEKSKGKLMIKKNELQTKCDGLKIVQDKEETNLNSNSNSESKKKSEQKSKPMPKSLTDLEYADIFQSVLERVAKDDDMKDEFDYNEDLHCAQEDILHNDESKALDVSNSDKDELDEIGIELHIDQWNDKPDECHVKSCETMKQDKKKKDHLQIGLACKLKKKTLDKGKACLPKSKSVNTDSSNPLKKKTANKEAAIAFEEEDEEEETGTWIQCSLPDCGKWRYVADVYDPLDVPDDWKCVMNSDKNHSSCDVPEVEYDESEHIMTNYTLGSVVWAKMDGFPWWPAMIDSDPDYDTYFELPTASSLIPYLYHVTFFDEHVSRAWIKSQCISPFDHSTTPSDHIAVKSRPYKQDKQIAVKNAKLAMKLSLQDRLNKHTFLKRYSKKTTKQKSAVPKKMTKRDKKGIAEEILLSSDAMLKELDMAIETCNDSDSMNSFEDSDDDVEFLPQKCRKESLSRAAGLNVKDKMKQDNNQDNESLLVVSDPGPDDDIVESCGVENENENYEHSPKEKYEKIEFDPNIFTMEIDKDQSFSNADDESVQNDGVEADIQMETVVDETLNLVKKENKLKCKNDKKTQNKTLKDISTSKRSKINSESFKSNDNEEKKDVKIQDVKQLDIGNDSEKENKDPKDSLDLLDRKDILPSIKRKTAEPSCNKNSFKKIKKLSLKDDAKKETKCDSGGKAADQDALNTTITERDKKENKTSLSNTEEKRNQSIIHGVSEDDRMNKCNNESTSKTDMGNQLGRDNQSKIKQKSGVKKKNNIKNEIHDKKDNEGESMMEIKQQPSDEKEKNTIKQKQSTELKKISKCKDFINPKRNKTMPKCNERKVPIIQSDANKKESSIIEPQKDQSVPDVTDNFNEEELNTLYNNDIETDKSVKIFTKSKQIDQNSSDEEELDLSIDSLDDKTECANVNIDKNDINQEYKSKSPKDKNAFGRFGGHCSDHEMDSDPFELIEE